MSAKKGMKKFGKHSVTAVVKDFTQLHEGAVPEHSKPVVVPTDPSTLSIVEKEEALDAVNLIQEKQNRDLKGQTCRNKSKQRQYLKYDDSMASPTISVEGLVTTMVIAMHEGRKVIGFDIPGAYL
eukprot:15339593-Ditylum_brightwellii.AAC.1